MFRTVFILTLVSALCASGATAATLDFKGDFYLFEASFGEMNVVEITGSKLTPTVIEIRDIHPIVLKTSKCTQLSATSVRCPAFLTGDADQIILVELRLGNMDDTLTVLTPIVVPVAVIAYGQTGDDTLNGSPNGDWLDGGWGKDTLNGGAGDDDLLGGENDDVLNGGAGADRLIGGMGMDILDGSSGADLLKGEEGPDILVGGGGGDRIEGGLGRDQIFAEDNEIDSIDCGPGDDVLERRDDGDLVQNCENES